MKESTYLAHTTFMKLHTIMALTLKECRYKHFSVKMNEQQILNFTLPYNILFKSQTYIILRLISKMF